MKVLIISSDRTWNDGYAINTGDALLTDAIVAQFLDRGDEVTVGDFGSARTNSDYPRTRIAGIVELVALVRRNDAVVIGGGTMIQEDSPKLLRGSLMRLCTAVSMVGRLAGVPVAFFAVGCDPLPRLLARIGYRVAVTGRPVWVRDVPSAERFENYFGRKAIAGADAALLFGLSHVRAISERPAALVVAPNRKDGGQLTAAWAERMGADFRTVIFMPMSSGEIDDLELIPTAALSLGSVATTANGWRDVMDQFAAASSVIASRMHALYVAALLGLPMVAVGTSPKVVSFANEFDVPRIDSFSEYRPGQERLAKADRLSAAVLRADSAFEALTRTLERGRP